MLNSLVLNFLPASGGASVFQHLTNVSSCDSDGNIAIVLRTVNKTKNEFKK